MAQDPACSVLSKYTLGSSAGKIQYISTWRAMSPNDLYIVGLVWMRTKPFLWEIHGARGREKHIFIPLKVRPAYWVLLANPTSRRLGEFSKMEKPCRLSYRLEKLLWGQLSVSASHETKPRKHWMILKEFQPLQSTVNLWNCVSLISVTSFYSFQICNCSALWTNNLTNTSFKNRKIQMQLNVKHTQTHTYTHMRTENNCMYNKDIDIKKIQYI